MSLSQHSSERKSSFFLFVLFLRFFFYLVAGCYRTGRGGGGLRERQAPRENVGIWEDDDDGPFLLFCSFLFSTCTEFLALSRFCISPVLFDLPPPVSRDIEKTSKKETCRHRALTSTAHMTIDPCLVIPLQTVIGKYLWKLFNSSSVVDPRKR